MVKRILAILTGVFVVTGLVCTFLPLHWLVLLFSSAAVLGALFFVLPFPYHRSAGAILLSVMLATSVLGLDRYFLERKQSELTDQIIHVTGEVSAVTTNGAGDLCCYRIALRKLGEEPCAFRRYGVYVYSRNSDLHIGDLIDLDITFFDTPIEYGLGKEDRILCSGYSEELTGTPLEGFSWRKTLDHIRTGINAQLKWGRADTVGLLRSVCLGDKENMPAELLVSLRRIGLSHITSVSGFHLAIAVLMFNTMLILLGIGHKVRYVIDIFVSVFFTVAVGMPLSCVRACIMITLLSLAMAFDLFPDSLTSLGVAASLVVLFNPQSIRDVGFLLSVSATLGMITLQRPIDRLLFPERISKQRWVNWLYRQFIGVFSCSAAATLATIPITILVFGSVSLTGPFANLVLLFPFQLFFYLGMGMLLFGWIPGVGRVLGFLCDCLYVMIERVAHFMGKIPFASVSRFDPVEIILLILLVLLIGVSVYIFNKHGRRCFWHLAALFLCFTVTFQTLYTGYREDGLLKIAFIDVGQGDCTVISRGTDAVILDYGGSSEKRYNLIEYLKQNEIFNVEHLFFTHLHKDHTNGLNTLEKNCYIKNITYPISKGSCDQFLVKLQAVDATSIAENVSFTALDGVKILALTDALDGAVSDENENCVCYRLEYGDISILITGDLAGSSELKISSKMQDTTILKVAHHGSDNSSTYPFLKAVSPEIAVVSVGENSYNLPGIKAMDRISSVVPAVYVTREHGSVVFKTDGKILERIPE